MLTGDFEKKEKVASSELGQQSFLDIAVIIRADS